MALGKCQPRQRMWGVSGTVILGVQIRVPAEKQMAMLDFLSTLHTTEHVVYLSRDSEGLSLSLNKGNFQKIEKYTKDENILLDGLSQEN